MKKATVIAEIGCNHKGDINLAKEFINTSRDFCKVNHVKFQKRENREVLTPEEYNSPHPNPVNSYGETYGEHREFLEFSLEQHKMLDQYCEERGMVYSCSVWDMISMKEIVSLEPEFIKIPSAANTNFEMLDYLCHEYPGLIHISLGMTKKQEERRLVDFFEKRGRFKDVILYACTSGYPVPPEDVCLLEIKRLVEEYSKRAHAIGFSGHHNGISIDIAAYALGATFIERHFTLDRTWKGTDHAASLEPDGLRRLNRDLQNVQKALNYKQADLLVIERPQRKKLKWDRNDANLDDNEVVLNRPKDVDFNRIKLVLMDVDGVLTDSGMYYTEKGDELKKFNTRDGQGIALLKEAGIKTGILTRENTEIVKRRTEKLGVDFVYQGVLDKLGVFNSILEEQKLSTTDVCYIGDDIYDIKVLEQAGFSAVPRDAVGACVDVSDYVCYQKGGCGCVRELVEYILNKRSNL
jgi:sialic acid synthase